MKKAARILAIVFGLAFLGATLLNADLIGRSRKALASGVFKDQSALVARRYELVVVMPETDDSFFSGLLAGIMDRAAAADAAVQVFRYPASSADDAERYFDIALRSKADGLIMYTPRNDPVARRLEAAARAGVVMIPVGTDAPAGGLPRFIGSSSLLQGFEGGRLICGKLGSSARIGIILPASREGDPRDEPIYKGVASAIMSFPGARIAALIRGGQGLLSGEESAASILRANPGINALFCTSARDTIGAAQVVVDLNKVGKVVIVGADETPEIDRYIEKGVIQASIVRDSRRVGQEAVLAFMDLKAGRPARESIEVGFSLRSARSATR